MIKQVIKMLSVDEFYNSSELIEFAKGKYKYPETFKELKKYAKRLAKTYKHGN